MIPVLQTERLVLRGPQRGDFASYAAFWAGPRSVHEGGPKGARAAWEDFAASFGLWTIDGIGNWAVEERASGAFAGIVGLNHPAHFPEVEIGWTLMDGYEGRGIATEGARAVLDWTWANTDLQSLTVYTKAENLRSIRVAERLGAVPDPEAARVDSGDVVPRIGRPS